MAQLDEYAYIQSRWTGLPLGYRQHDYQLVKVANTSIVLLRGWGGGQVVHNWKGPIRLSDDFLDRKYEVGEIIHLGAYRMRVIDNQLMFMGWCECRLDSPYWRIYLYSSRAARALRFFYYRLIITAHVWGLARRDEMAIPSWRDVYVLDKLAKLVKR